MGYAPSLAYVGFAKQSSQGTAVAPTTFSRWTAMPDAQEHIKPGFYHGGYTRDRAVGVKEQQYHDVKYNGWMYPDSTTALLNFFLGGSDTVTNTSDPWQHAFNEVESPLPWVSAEHSMGAGIEVDRVVDCLVDEVTIECKAGGLVTVNHGLLGRYGTPQGSSATVTLETDRPATYGDGTLAFGSGVSVVTADVMGFKLTMKNGSNRGFAIGSINPRITIPGNREVDLEFELFGTDVKPYRDIFYGGDAATAQVAAMTILASFQATFDLGGSPDHLLKVKVSNIGMYDAKGLIDVNSKPFTWSCKGSFVRTSGNLLQVTASNAASAAYV